MRCSKRAITRALPPARKLRCLASMPNGVPDLHAERARATMVIVRSLVAISVVLPIAAAAQNPPEAERLFIEGRALLTAGKPEEACAKFEQSLAKDPRQIGVLMNLGLCNERAGKIASALRLYQEAFDRAVEANLQNARELAQDQINKLAAKVPVVALNYAGARLPGQKLVIDDEVIANERTEVRLDPGPHDLVLTAPGRVAYEKKLHLDVGSRTTIELPMLEVPKSRVVARRVSGRRLGGAIAAFGGLGVALAGTGMFVYAKQDYDQLFKDGHCGMYERPDGTPTCDAIGQPRSERDRNLAITGGVIASVGVLTAATGVVLWLTSPRETDTVIQPTATPTSVGVSITGSFY